MSIPKGNGKIPSAIRPFDHTCVSEFQESARHNEVQNISRYGKLLSHKVIKYIPQFGEEIGKKGNTFWMKIAALVGAVQVGVFAGAACGFFIGGIPGALIGTSIALGSIATVAICAVVVAQVLQHKFQRVIPDHLKPNLNNNSLQEPPRLGHYYSAHVRLASTADEGLKWKKEIIASAEESIEISANFAGGSSFREILDLIDARMREKPRLKAHLILSPDLLEAEDRKKLKALREQWGNRFNYLIADRITVLTPRLHTEENHVKMVIVDGKYFVSGGTGIHPRLNRETDDSPEDKETPTLAATLLDRTCRDMDLIGESSSIGELMRQQFFRLYQIWEIRARNQSNPTRYFPLAKATQSHCAAFHVDDGALYRDVRIKFFVSGPEHGERENPITKQYVKRIGKAEKKIRLASLMLNPVDSIIEALRNARAQGTKRKKIIAYLNGTGEDSPLSRRVNVIPSRQHYVLMDTVYEYNKAHQIFHKKVATFDTSHMIIGSYNLGKKSGTHDHESIFVIKDPKITRRCIEILKEDQKRSKEINREKIIKNHHWNKLKAFFIAPLVENFA